MELKCPSYDYVLDMTWREFTLRRAAYLNQQTEDDKKNWIHTREIVYCTLVAGGCIDPKKLPIDKFMPIGNGVKKKEISNRAKELYMKAINEALNGGSRSITGGKSSAIR